MTIGLLGSFFNCLSKWCNFATVHLPQACVWQTIWSHSSFNQNLCSLLFGRIVVQYYDIAFMHNGSNLRRNLTEISAEWRVSLLPTRATGSANHQRLLPTHQKAKCLSKRIDSTVCVFTQSSLLAFAGLKNQISKEAGHEHRRHPTATIEVYLSS